MRTRSAFPSADGVSASGDFASVLASLGANEARAFYRPVAGLDRLWTQGCGEGRDAAAIAGAYAEQQRDAAPSARKRLDFGEIAARIAAAGNADELHRLRRAVALATHPDRVPVEGRAEAERLMARVNAAIDDALFR